MQHKKLTGVTQHDGNVTAASNKNPQPCHKSEVFVGRKEKYDKPCT